MAQVDQGVPIGFSARDAYLFAEDGTAFARHHIPEIALLKTKTHTEARQVSPTA
ncbi:hypothetical protein BOSEA31B_12614 [Hyphomicrobiales bacterium]|nr:hypothetical protein BOSEA31B_12614 [Hyphomicrobiales bacterium]CAH1698383.1 hypothetical protein BOSEA1005_11436 [Hyphomicrobiales bacterium]CAI0342036.1 hypothetical protein BO1005MUT1_160015 [Hyphomicrobiales bacterium]